MMEQKNIIYMVFLINVYGIVQQKMMILLSFNIKVQMVNLQFLILIYTLIFSGEDGFPGEVNVTVKYKLTSDHRLIIDFYATTTQATPINMTNHAYFNLGGDVKRFERQMCSIIYFLCRQLNQYSIIN